MRSASLFAWLGWLLACAPASAQVPAPLADYFRDVWTTREGLPHNTINAIAQTPDGYLWLATWEGPTRFNGRGFLVHDRHETLGLPDAGVRALQVDADGTLLVGGSRGGIARHDGSLWIGLPPIPGHALSMHRDRRGRLWIGTEGSGLLRIDADGSRQRIAAGDAAGNGIADILEDADGRLWAATSSGLREIVDDALVAPADEVDGAVARASVTALAIAADGRLLVGGERGVHRRGEDGRFGPLAAELANTPVSQLLVDADGSVWIGTTSAGLARVSARGVERLGIEDGLPDPRVLALLRDRENSLWVGTNGGLLRLRDAPMVSITRQRGLAGNFVRSVLAHSDGSLWVGSSEGLSRIDERGARTTGAGSALEGQSILSLAQAPDGDVWIGTFAGGALRWDGARVVQRLERSDGLPANEVRALLHAADGALWVGTAQGVARVGDGRVETWAEADGLPGNFVIALMQDRHGRIWIGTGGGVAIHDGQRLQPLPLHGVDGASFAFAFWEDREHDEVWIATDRGLLRHRGDDGQLGLVGRRAGLPFEKLFSLVADRDGHFWASGNRGVLRLARDAARRVADGHAATLPVDWFSETDGMASRQGNGGSGPAAALRADGSVWFATALGVAAVQPARLARFSERAPPVVIERLAINGQPLPLRDGLTLPPGSHRLDIDFAGLGFLMPEHIRYRYRLDGFDVDWVERGTQAHAELTNLPPGDYRFRVSASYPQGEWSTQEASWRFSIAPQPWQRTDVRVLAALAALALIALAVRLRMRQLALREQRLRVLVERRTDDLNRQTERLLAVDAERSALVEQLRQQSEAFERQAREDALTGLPNRRAFDERLALAAAQSRRAGIPLCLALIDIDHFKQINDRHSHAAGDTALKAVADCLRQASREIDSVARWGGEEFALLLPGTTLDDASGVAERLRTAIEAIDGDHIAPGLRLTASIGLAADTGHGHHDRLVSRADAVLYRAKQEGRNRVRVDGGAEPASALA